MTLLACLLLAQAATSGPSQKPATDDATDVRHFVQRFYDWYMPRRPALDGWGYKIPDLGSKLALLSPSLRTAYEDDRRAQGQIKGMTVGLVCDPFLGQNFYGALTISDIHPVGDAWLVDIHDSSPGLSTHLKAKVAKTNSGWELVNFDYGNEDLLTDLRDYSQSIGVIQRYTAKPLSHDSAFEARSVRRFVQGFYNWYGDTVAAELAEEFRHPGRDVEMAEVRAIRTRPAAFTPELVRDLWIDERAREKAIGYIDSLDFDPFINSQDPDRHFRVGLIEHRGNYWLARVKGVRPNDDDSGADVIAVIEKTKGKYGWRFVNFLYNGGGDLLSTLHALGHAPN